VKRIFLSRVLWYFFLLLPFLFPFLRPFFAVLSSSLFSCSPCLPPQTLATNPSERLGRTPCCRRLWIREVSGQLPADPHQMSKRTKSIEPIAAAPRNDLDGRGNLSEEALAESARYLLSVCMDQVDRL
jgi:hypothetical protein